MTFKEFVFSPIYYIHAGNEYRKASKRLTVVEKLSKEGKIPFSEHLKAFDEYQPYYDATWKYFGPAIAMIWILVTIASLFFLALALLLGPIATTFLPS